MNRAYLPIVLVLALLAAVWTRSAEAAFPLDADTMKAALHTAEPEEDGFIDYVIRRVTRGPCRKTWSRARSSGQERSRATSFSTSSKP